MQNYYLIDFKRIVNQSNVYYLKSNDLLNSRNPKKKQFENYL